MKPRRLAFVEPTRTSLLVGMLICLILTLLLMLWLLEPAIAQKKLSAAEAKDHIGEDTTVCGEVVSTRYAASTKGHPTFLNLDKPYPNQIFTATTGDDPLGRHVEIPCYVQACLGPHDPAVHRPVDTFLLTVSLKRQEGTP